MVLQYLTGKEDHFTCICVYNIIIDTFRVYLHGASVFYRVISL